MVLLGLGAAAARLAAQPAPPPVPGAAGASVTSAQPADAGSGPLIQFDGKEYNFGKAEAGEVVKHVFIVTNAGSQVLEITNVHPGCGCTTSGNWSRQIAPGQTGTIPIEFNSARYSGSVTKTIAVYSNAKDHPQETLSLQGTVWKVLEVSPQTATINLLPDATNSVSTTVRITNQSDQTIAISDPTSSSKSFTAELKTTTPGKEYELVITAVPPFPVGNTPGTISVKTSLPSTPVLNVFVTAMVQPEILVSPQKLTLGPSPSVWTTNRLFIRGNGASVLTLSDPECSDARVHVQISPIGTRGMYNLVIALPPDYQIEPGQQVEISVKSNYPRNPVIKVPVVQLPRTAAVAQPVLRSSGVQAVPQTAGHP